MRPPRKYRRVVLPVILYLTLCLAAGILVAEGALHPARRALPLETASFKREVLNVYDAPLVDAFITTKDGVILRAWLIHPHNENGDAVILLHGLADNRVGMTGYARLLLAHGYIVLLPDARAHGASGGALATYGLLERKDIRQWFDFLLAQEHPRCVFGLGESMGAAELLQSLSVESRFCAVVAESSFSNFREIAYDRMGQPFRMGPWLRRTLLRPVVEFAFLYVRWKYGLNMQQVSPEDSVAASSVPVLLIHGQIDHNIPVRHSRRIQVRNPTTVLWEVPGADHCGAISTAPHEFQQRLLTWLWSHDSRGRAGSEVHLRTGH